MKIVQETMKNSMIMFLALGTVLAAATIVSSYRYILSSAPWAPFRVDMRAL